jgi:hypothetical protein
MVSVTSDLQDAIESARRELATRNDGHIPLRLRKRIWMAMGDIPDPETHIPPLTIGHKARAILAIQAVRAVVHIWKSCFPDIGVPEQLIQLSEQYLTGTSKPEDIQAIKQPFRGGLDNTHGLSNQELNALLVGWAAVRMATTVVFGDDFIDEDIDEEDGDLDMWDASMYAAGAAAGGFPFIKTGPYSSDPNRLRHFWEWYLEQAERSYIAALQHSE